MMRLRPSSEVNTNSDANATPPREGIDTPFGPPPEEYLYRYPVCGEEAWVNKEIVDVTIGRLKFDGDYQGGLPTLGCPGCEGKTMGYVEEDASVAQRALT
jgi:hypothetical protein